MTAATGAAATGEILVRIEAKLDAIGKHVTDLAQVQAVQEHRLTRLEAGYKDNRGDIDTIERNFERIDATLKIIAGALAAVATAAGLWIVGQILSVV